MFYFENIFLIEFKRILSSTIFFYVCSEKDYLLMSPAWDCWILQQFTILIQSFVQTKIKDKKTTSI